MENYKVRVENIAEANHAQQLFEYIGYEKGEFVDAGFPKLVVAVCDDDAKYSAGSHLCYSWCECQELTIDQLRDLVAAKTKKVPYLVKTIDKWEEQQLTSDTPESATCLRIPSWAGAAHVYGNYVFFTYPSDVAGNTIWQRLTHPEELPFIDDEPKHDDNVNHPSHYTQGSIECIEALEAATVNKQGIEAVCVANVIKYLWRYESKNGLEDVKKAQWYLQKLVDNLEQNNE